MASRSADTIERNRLPLKPFLDLIDARSFDLYDDPPADWTALEGYCGETSSALVSLGSIILTRGEASADPDAAGHAGVAYALTGLLRAFPWHARRGQIFVPQIAAASRRDRSGGYRQRERQPGASGGIGRNAGAGARPSRQGARPQRRGLRPEMQPAFLPLAMVERYLAPMDTGNYHPFKTIVDAANWLRVWAMWRGW